MIGENTNIQDNTHHPLPPRQALRHRRQIPPIGHNVTLGDCTIGERSLIGIGSVVAAGTVIEDEVFLAAGAETIAGQVLEHALNKMLVLELARGTYLEQRENVIALGPSGTGKTHIALGLGLAACQRGLAVGFTTAAALVHELLEARDERRLLRLQKQLTAYKLLIVDELGYVPLSPSGAELLFEVFSRRYERGSVLVTSNLPFDEWTSVFGSERLTGALLDRLTHHVHILEMNGESYRLKASRRRQGKPEIPTNAS